MTIPSARTGNLDFSRMERLPVVRFWTRIPGFAYIMAWSHRLTGILLVLYIGLHIATLSYLKTPFVFDENMKLFGGLVFIVLEWMLAIPVIFHTLNGGRLILYESFGNRKDEFTIRIVMGTSLVYIILVGLLMILKNDFISPVPFWIAIGVVGFSLCGLTAKRIWRSRSAATWKLQRITGSFLLIVVPAHLAFMQTHPDIGHSSGLIIERMQHGAIRFMDLSLLVGSVYHGGYGLVSILKDYLPAGILTNFIRILVFSIMAYLAWTGTHLTLTI
ncbi:MAG: hypothetical protein GY866_15885 [Proteobacteria bacterium]|nr:hypothetical protein [Pseudomonadota bacterium]